MTISETGARRLSGVALLLWISAVPASAATLNFTVNASEPVTVTGTPRIAVDVGGVTRYATYASGSGTAALVFGYAVQPGDFDADGITLASPLELNGGRIADIAGNPATALTFTVPDTAALKVQTYMASFTTDPITDANASAVTFAIAKAPTGASFGFTITSSGGSGSVTGSGTISGASHSVSGVDVSALPAGTLTLSVVVSTAAGGTGSAKTATVATSFTGVLDSLPATAAAYSVRRLRGSYGGPLLRVQRSSDNALQDIGATVAGTLDSANLGDFCGSASCTVSTWYDQSGNGRDAVQSTAGARPVIVNGGVIEQLGTRAGLRFDTGKLIQASNPLTNANEFTIVTTMVERVRQTNWTWRLLVSTLVSPRVSCHAPWYNGILYYDVQTGTSGRLARVWPYAVGTAVTATFWNSVSANSRGVYLNGSPFLSGAGLTAASDALVLADGYSGQMSEFILFPSSLSNASRQAMERSQGSYYGTPVP